MKLMVACTTLTWIEVNTESGEVGPARVFNLPENVEVDKLGGEKPVVLSIEPEEDDQISEAEAQRAVELVNGATGYEFTFEEDRRWSVARETAGSSGFPQRLAESIERNRETLDRLAE